MSLRRAPLFAKALLEKLDLQGVPDVWHIAQALHVEIKEADVRSFDGALVRIKGSIDGVIAVRQSIREMGRKNFTIAHELGHLLLPGHDESAVCRQNDVETWDKGLPPQELEANEFAGELLLPTSLIHPIIAREKPTFELIEAVARDFSTSLTATAYRFIELTSHACAIVWSEAGIAKWCRRSEEFRQWIRLQERLDRRTFASDCFEGGSIPDRPEQVPATAWLEGDLLEDATIFEETRCMRSYEGSLSLLWIAEPLADRHDESVQADTDLDPGEFTLHRKRWPSKR